VGGIPAGGKKKIFRSIRNRGAPHKQKPPFLGGIGAVGPPRPPRKKKKENNHGGQPPNSLEMISIAFLFKPFRKLSPPPGHPGEKLGGRWKTVFGRTFMGGDGGRGNHVQIWIFLFHPRPGGLLG